MDNLQLFRFETHDIEVIIFNNEPLFNPRHIGDCLDMSYEAVRKNIQNMSDQQVIKLTNSNIQDMNIRRLHNTGENFLTEKGVYKLIFKSRNPKVEIFQDWLCDDALPSIRKTATCLESIEYKGSIEGLVFSRDGLVITTSLNIAKIFGKEHKEILGLIDNKIKDFKKIDGGAMFSQCNFTPSNYIDIRGKVQRAYELTEGGFSFIALGLTGKKANEFKIQFINAFFTMREAITNMFKARVIESVLPQKNNARQYVYIIESVDMGTIKIGVAQNVEKRLMQLQTGSSSKLELVYKSIVCSNGFNIEKIVHDKFKSNHVRGEWYKLRKQEAIEFIEKQTFVLKSEFLKYVSVI